MASARDNQDSSQRARRLLDEGRGQEAEKLLREALADSPHDAALLKELARCLVRLRRMLPALQTYNRVIELGAADAAVWLEAGCALSGVREYARALGALEESLRMEPTDEARYEKARAAFGLGDVDTAAALFEAVSAATDSIQAWSSLAKIIPGVPSANHARVREIRCAFADRLRRLDGTPHRARPRPYRAHDRPRVGYLSGFFDHANYMKPVWGLVNHHDRHAFDVHLFSDTPAAAGWEGYRRHPADRIHEVHSLSNFELADLLRRCEIDILIDLNGYSSAGRLSLFVEPVAPVVAAWFNMYATSGLAGLDIIIGDRQVVRADEENEYTERVVCLPGSYLTFEVGHDAPPVQPPPCENQRRFTFGSLVSQYKMTGVVLDAWAEILRRVDSSRLVLANRALQSPCNREYVAKQFADRGVECERLEFLPGASHYEFLGYYGQVDLALDAFPYNGGTTTMEAIWQGVPVLSFDGDRWASRTSQTLLRRTHLADFVAPGREQYVQMAVDIARSQIPRALARLRKSMRDRLRESPACDTAALARAMEEVYRRLSGEAS